MKLGYGITIVNCDKFYNTTTGEFDWRYIPFTLFPDYNEAEKVMNTLPSGIAYKIAAVYSVPNWADSKGNVLESYKKRKPGRPRGKNEAGI